VHGELALRGVTKPLHLTINSFECSLNPMTKKDTCGADASAIFNRDEFGIDYGKDALGFNMQAELAFQVEAVKAN
jgi:polyisoprenoid-binding protein YceI